MKQKKSTVVNITRRFVNKTNGFIVDNIRRLVNDVNEKVNNASRVMLTPKCSVFNAIGHLSTMSTIKILKMYMNRIYSIYVHNSRLIRARVRISRIRVFKKKC